jgi:hypothetical protein
MRRKPAKKKSSAKKSSGKELSSKRKTIRKKSAPRKKAARSKSASAQIHQGVFVAEPAGELETAPETPEETGEEAEYGGES